MRMETDPVTEVLFQMKIMTVNNIQKIDHFIISTITNQYYQRKEDESFALLPYLNPFSVIMHKI